MSEPNEDPKPYERNRYSLSCCAPDIVGFCFRMRDGMNNPANTGLFWRVMRCLFGKKPCGPGCLCHKGKEGS